MAASLTTILAEGSPGNTVTLNGSGLVPGAGASVVLGGQLLLSSTGAAPTYTGTLNLNATFATTSVSFPVRDGATNGPLTVTAADGTTATCELRVESQYVQSSEYIDEGIDTSDLLSGELDQILREASGYIDAFIAQGDRDVRGLRLLQTVELHKFRPRRSGPPRFWPYRRPIVSLDSCVFVTSQQIRTAFNTSQTTSSDVYLNADLGYVEMLAYAFGNYVLLGQIETIGFSANVVEIGYTAGYAWNNYPLALRKACKIVATELLTYRQIQARGAGGLDLVRHGYQQYKVRPVPFAIPQPARELLRPFVSRRMA